jgi:uncharacterized protein YceK
MASLLAGCTTIANIDGEKKVYGGMQLNVIGPYMLAMAANPFHDPDDYKRTDYLLVGSALLIDLPFSLVGDTFTLPITIPAAYRRFATELEHTDDATGRRKNSPIHVQPQQTEDVSEDRPKLEPPTESVEDETPPLCLGKTCQPQ